MKKYIKSLMVQKKWRSMSAEATREALIRTRHFGLLTLGSKWFLCFVLFLTCGIGEELWQKRNVNLGLD
jgi:hypothetical protein